MDIPINSELIDQLKASRGFQNISLAELKQVYDASKDRRAKVIAVEGDGFVVLAELPGIEFRIRGVSSQSSYNFIDEGALIFIDAMSHNVNYFKFLANEFTQGDGGYEKVRRFVATCLPLIALNILGLYYAGTNGAKDVLSGVLAAVSIFVAIFSLFTTSQDYLLRKRLSLFETGRIGYFFSVDNHITRTGVYSILISIVGLLVSTGFDETNKPLYQPYSRNVIVIAAINLSFLGVYLTLRAIIEFYVKRPAKFILGDLKRESFEAYRRQIQPPEQ